MALYLYGKGADTFASYIYISIGLYTDERAVYCSGCGDSLEKQRR